MNTTLGEIHYIHVYISVTRHLYVFYSFAMNKMLSRKILKSQIVDA